MCPVHFRDAVAEIERRVDLIDAGDRDAHGERIERDVLDTLERRRLYHDARSPSPGHETLGRQADPPPTVRKSDIIRVAHEADMELVDAVTGQHRVGAKREQL